MFLIDVLPGKVVISAESRLKLYYAKSKTEELRPEEDNVTDVKSN